LDLFNNLLGNTVSSNLEVPGLSSDVIESANSMFGVNIQYHGSSESSNDNFDFSLEFKDTKLLHVYSFFKAYEAAGGALPLSGAVLISLNREDKPEAASIAKSFAEEGFKIYATGKTYETIIEAGIEATRINKNFEGGRPNVEDIIKNGDDPNTAWEKAQGQYGRVADAVKIIDPRKE